MGRIAVKYPAAERNQVRGIAQSVETATACPAE